MSRATDQIEADIEARREHLAETVDALAHKFDVPAHARVEAARVRAGAAASQVELTVTGVGLAVAAVAYLYLRRQR